MAHITIKIKPETREKLARLKSSKSETYDELLNTLIMLAEFEKKLF